MDVQDSRRRPAPEDRTARQVRALDAWNEVRRQREEALAAAGRSRDAQVDAARQAEVLRRTHEAVTRHAARVLDVELGPLHVPGPTAVLAHRNAWFAEKTGMLLERHGVTVVACTDNGPDALGALVVEQPDVLLVGDRVAMMTTGVLLADARALAPQTLRALLAADPASAQALQAGADAVYLRQHPPAVTDALVDLITSVRPAPG